MSHFHHILKGVLSQSAVDADLSVYLGSLTTPLSAGQITKLNTFVKDLKSGLGIANLSDAFDVMYIHANETSESGLKNLAKRAHDATLNGLDGVPLFTALEGFTGGTDAQRRRIESGFIASTHGENLKLNDASYGVYQRTEGTRPDILFGVVSTAHVILLESGVATRLHSTNTNSIGAPPAGLTILSRAEAASYKHYKNKTEGSITQAATALPEHDIWLLGYNDNGDAPPTNYGENMQLSFFFAGKALSQANVNTITDTFETYMDSNGKGVIP